MEKETMVFDERIRSALERICPGQPARVAAELAARIHAGGAVARVRLGSARDSILMAAIADRLVAEPGLRALIVAPSDREVAGLKGAFDAVGARAGVTCSTLGRDSAADESDAIIGSMDAIASRAASGSLDARSFELVALSDLDAMADAANAAMLRRALGPATSTRRVVAFSSELLPAGRSIARDLAGAFDELELEAEGERSRSADSSSYLVSADDKLGLLLGIMKSNTARPFAVFCDVRGTAEDAMRRLRSAGLRVEYILGNLPRKRAVLESVKAGDYEVLVLTDEGAEGLPGGWAAAVVNWDLPLEGEPYLARIGQLDASRTGARVYNFVCERYAFGLPAIERALGSSLGAVPVDRSMMAPVEAAAVSAPAAVRPDERNGRRGQDSGDRSNGRRNDDDRRDRGGQYDGRNARAIQADIAAITGGGALGPVKPPSGERDAPARKRGRRDQPSRASAAKAVKPAPKGSQRAERSEGGKPREGASPRDPQASKPGSRQRRGARGKSGGARLTDPYSVSMEERLRLYRERYGSGDAQSNGSGDRAKPGQKPDARKGRHPQAARLATDRPKTDRPQDRRQDSRGGQGRGRDGGQDRTAPAQPRQDQHEDREARSTGIVGAIRNLFGKKK